MAEKPEDIDEKIDYGAADRFWKAQPATVDGMLGGFGSVSRTDVHTSTALLKSYYKPTGPRPNRVALDCGAGIGRVSKLLLLPIFNEVDLVEQNSAFLDKSEKYLGSLDERIGEKFCCGLQDFSAKEGHYDLIWIQWVVIYLTDADFVSFLKRCKKGLTETGLIAIKDNITNDERVYDEEDSSSTRTDEEMRSIFSEAGLTVLEDRLQTKFPDGMYPIKMYVMR